VLSVPAVVPGNPHAVPARMTPDKPRPLLNRWTVAATVAGNALEFYDFLTYSTFAVYIGHAFFPTGKCICEFAADAGDLWRWLSHAPLGGLLIGAYADRAGRRPALMLTISLMTVGTLGLVLTPSYASIGMSAPAF
jgi:MFS family permease